MSSNETESLNCFYDFIAPSHPKKVTFFENKKKSSSFVEFMN